MLGQQTFMKFSLHDTSVPWQTICMSPYWSTQRCPPNKLWTQVVTLFQL